MSRPTLKLSANKPVTPTDGENRPLSRKPVRAGFTAPKQSAAQRASSNAAKAARLAAAGGKTYSAKPRTPKRFNDDAPRAPARPAEAEKADKAAKNEKNWVKEAPQARAVRAPEPPKVYPKRGIARSTGVRAAYSERSAPRAAPERFAAPVAPVPAPALARHAAPSSPPQAIAASASRRPLNEPPRLAKRISEMCQCSRREADEWIENGWVYVDGVVVKTLGTRVHPNAKIEIKEAASKHQTESVTILFSKPLAMASEQGDGEAALQLIRPENRWAEDETRLSFKATHLRGLALAGKLDAESTGMLVFTQEGSVARRITGDDTRLEKEYMVRVEGELTPEGMQRLNHGLSLDDVKLKRAQVSWQNEQQLRFVLHETKKRQIQRMCELVGLRVISIKRIRIGSVSLGKLPAGQWRYLRENERF